MRSSSTLVCVSAAAFALGSVPSGLLAETARFVVRDNVVNPDVPPFSATVAEIGNGVQFLRAGSSFEPSHFRTWIVAGEDAANDIVAAPQILSGWNSWPDGFLDGAGVEVLRIVNGKFTTVRTDTVAPGGYHASGWLRVTPRGQALDPSQTRTFVSWENYNRLDVPWYYTVRAVDRSGRMSSVATAVSVQPPTQPGSAPQATLIKLAQKEDDATGDGAAPGSSDLAVPQNLTARLTISRTLELSWDPVPGAAGYVVYRSSVPPDQMKGYSMHLAGTGAPIKAGDMVILRKTFFFPPRAEVATGRVWSSSRAGAGTGIRQLPGFPGDPGLPEMKLVPYGDDHPVPEGGRTYLQVTLKPGQTLPIGNYNYSGTAQTYYPVLDPTKTYRFEVWLRSKGGVSATFQLSGPMAAETTNLPAVFHPTGQWQRYTVDFRVPSIFAGAQAGKMLLTLSGTGQVDVDNFRIFRADTPFMDVLPENKEALEKSGLEALRSHYLVKTGTATYDLDQLTAPAGVNTASSGASLPQFLTICKETHINPWLQIEPHLTREEWLGLVEYLAAPFDPAKDDPKALPWAARRVAEGHPAPWTDDFNKIFFEIGNETWNGLMAPWIFPGMQDGGTMNWTGYSNGAVYGLFQEHVLSILRESPWWGRLAPKLDPVLGGWAVNTYGFDALKKSPSSKVVTVADYIGGWDSGEGPVRPVPEGYASVMAAAPQVTGRFTQREAQALKASGFEGKVALGTYEAGPGYALNGLNGRNVTAEQRALQEKVMKSAAAGAATLDVFLMRAQAGDRLQNYFTFGRGSEWTSHALWQDGGQSYPAWDWLTLFNHVGTGDVLAVDTEQVPRQDLPQMGRREALAGAPMAAVYAARKDDRLTVTVISREVPDVPAGNDAKMSVEVDLPITGAKSVTHYAESGPYTAENVSSQQTRMVSQPMPVPADPSKLDIADLPPASAQVYVFEGVTFAK